LLDISRAGTGHGPQTLDARVLKESGARTSAFHLKNGVLGLLAVAFDRTAGNACDKERTGEGGCGQKTSGATGDETKA
jgi:hypothetical protein